MSDNGQDDVQWDAEPGMEPLEPRILYDGSQVQDEVVAAVNNTMAVGNQMIAPLLVRAQTLEWELMRSQGTIFTLQQGLSVLSFREQEHLQLLEGLKNENSRLVDKCNRLLQNRAPAMGDAGETFDAIDSTMTRLEQTLLSTQREADRDEGFQRWMLRVAQLEGDNDDLRKQVADLELKHEDDRKQDQQCIEELQVDKKTLQQAKASLKRELEMSKKTIAGLEKQVSDVQLEVTVYEEVCQELRTDVGNLKAQLHKEKELCQELRTDVGKLKAQLHKEKEVGGADQQRLMESLKAQFKELINDVGQC
jgi:chromosome segregation ATPase